MCNCALMLHHAYRNFPSKKLYKAVALGLNSQIKSRGLSSLKLDGFQGYT